MGREVRRVAADWTHPVGQDGKFTPLFAAEMPRWTPGEASHYQMYETTSPGTPISPVMASPQALAHWLVEHQASAFAGQTASYEAWLGVCEGKPVFSCAIDQGTFISGVEYANRPQGDSGRAARPNRLARNQSRQRGRGRER